MLSPIHNCIPVQMIFCLSLPAAVATGVEDKSGVSPVRTLPTRSRAQALNMRGCVSVCERVCESVCWGGGICSVLSCIHNCTPTQMILCVSPFLQLLPLELKIRVVCLLYAH